MKISGAITEESERVLDSVFTNFSNFFNAHPDFEVVLVKSRKEFNRVAGKEHTETYKAVTVSPENEVVIIAPEFLEKESVHPAKAFSHLASWGIGYVFAVKLNKPKWLHPTFCRIFELTKKNFLKCSDFFAMRGQDVAPSKVNFLVLKEGKARFFEFVKSSQSLEDFFGYSEEEFDKLWKAYLKRNSVKDISEDVTVIYNPEIDDITKVGEDCLEAYSYNKKFFKSNMHVFVQVADSRAELEKVSGFNHGKWFVGSGCGNNLVVVLSEKIVKEEAVKKEFSLRQLMAHEIAHVFINRLSHKKIPIWLNEGIAMVVAKQERKGDFNQDIINCNSGEDWERFNFPYASAYGFTRYLFNRFGKDRMLEFVSQLSKMGAGSFGDNFNIFFGVPLSGVCDGWIEGLAPDEKKRRFYMETKEGKNQENWSYSKLYFL